jgi:hypothetical protein
MDYIAKPDEVRKLTLEIVEILRKSSDINVAGDVFGEISQIWEQNIVGEDAMYFEEEDYNEEYDLHLKK